MGWYFVQAVITNSTCTSHPHIWDSLTSRKSSISENFSKVTNSNLLGWHLLQPNFTGWYIDPWLVWSWPLHMTNKTTGATPRQCGEGALSFWYFLILIDKAIENTVSALLLQGGQKVGNCKQEFFFWLQNLCFFNLQRCILLRKFIKKNLLHR